MPIVWAWTRRSTRLVRRRGSTSAVKGWRAKSISTFKALPKQPACTTRTWRCVTETAKTWSGEGEARRYPISKAQTKAATSCASHTSLRPMNILVSSLPSPFRTAISDCRTLWCIWTEKWDAVVWDRVLTAERFPCLRLAIQTVLKLLSFQHGCIQVRQCHPSSWKGSLNNWPAITSLGIYFAPISSFKLCQCWTQMEWFEGTIASLQQVATWTENGKCANKQDNQKYTLCDNW